WVKLSKIARGTSLATREGLRRRVPYPCREATVRFFAGWCPVSRHCHPRGKRRLAREESVWQDVIRDGARRFLAYRLDIIGATAWAIGLLRDVLVRPEKIVVRGNVGVVFLVFEGPNGLGAFDGFEIGDTSSLSGGLACLEEV